MVVRQRILNCAFSPWIITILLLWVALASLLGGRKGAVLRYFSCLVSTDYNVAKGSTTMYRTNDLCLPVSIILTPCDKDLCVNNVRARCSPFCVWGCTLAGLFSQTPKHPRDREKAPMWLLPSWKKKALERKGSMIWTPVLPKKHYVRHLAKNFHTSLNLENHTQEYKSSVRSHCLVWKADQEYQKPPGPCQHRFRQDAIPETSLTLVVCSSSKSWSPTSLLPSMSCILVFCSTGIYAQKTCKYAFKANK